MNDVYFSKNIYIDEIGWLEFYYFVDKKMCFSFTSHLDNAGKFTIVKDKHELIDNLKCIFPSNKIHLCYIESRNLGAKNDV